MKVSGVTISHLIRQYEIESSRSDISIGELDCRNMGRFSANVFSALVSRFRYPRQDFITRINWVLFDIYIYSFTCKMFLIELKFRSIRRKFYSDEL